MPDFNMLKNDIDNRFPLNTTSHVAVGDGYTAKSVVTIGGALVKQGGFRLSAYDAYNCLRDSLIDGQDLLITITESQRNALTMTAAEIGRVIYNTDATVEIWNSTAWDPV